MGDATAPSIKIHDSGHLGVLQLQDQVVIESGDGIQNSMTVERFLTTDTVLKGKGVSERLALLIKMDGGYSIARPLQGYVEKIIGGKRELSSGWSLKVVDEGHPGTLQLDDKVTVTQGGKSETITIRHFLSDPRFEHIEHDPRERLARLIPQDGGYAVTDEVRSFAKDMAQKFTTNLTLQDGGYKGVIQKSDQVTVTLAPYGAGQKSVTVEEFLKSDEFASYGTFEERLDRLSSMDGGYAVAEDVIGLKSSAQPLKFPKVRKAVAPAPNKTITPWCPPTKGSPKKGLK